MLENQVTIVGTITHDIKTDLPFGSVLYYSTYIEVKRPSGRPDSIMIVATKEQFENSLVQVGARIHIEGRVETRNEYDSNRKRKVTTYVMVEELYQAPYEPDKNKVMLIGGLCDKPSTWTVKNGPYKANFVLAVRDYKKKVTYFISCTAWRRNYQKVKNLNKGDVITITGEFHSRIYNKFSNDGNKEKATAYEIEIGEVI